MAAMFHEAFDRIFDYPASNCVAALEVPREDTYAPV
jgi:hypothetical protein